MCWLHGKETIFPIFLDYLTIDTFSQTINFMRRDNWLHKNFTSLSLDFIYGMIFTADVMPLSHSHFPTFLTSFMYS